jgi:hypothetical protein
MAQSGDLKVWHIPQVPMKAFEVSVKNTEEAIIILDVLADYDIFQYENNVKPDYCNVQGLLVYDENSDGDGNADWVEWEDQDGNNIDDVRRRNV